MLNEYQLGTLIYREYRSKSIHELEFDVDDHFFTEPGTYLATVRHAWDSTNFLTVQLSASWLIDLYRDAVKGYERALLARKKLPIGLWIQLYGEPSETEYLDDDSVADGKTLRIRIDR